LQTVSIELDEELSPRDMVNKYIKEILEGLGNEHEVYVSLPEDGREDFIVDRILTMMEGYLWMRMPVDDVEIFYKDIFFSPRPDFVLMKDPVYVFKEKR